MAILAGELFGLLMTAERIVVGREAQQAPLHQASVAYAAAGSRVAETIAALSRVPVTSPRLEAANAAKSTADRAVIEKSDARGCMQNCRALLQKAADDARDEVDAARAELAKVADRARGEVAKARAALEGMRAPASATPLADRLHVPAWAIDLIAAALGAIGANGLGCILLAFAGHRPRVLRVRRRRRVLRRVVAMPASASTVLESIVPVPPEAEIPIEIEKPAAVVPAIEKPSRNVVAFRVPVRAEKPKGRLGGSKIGHPAHFLYEVIEPDQGARLDVLEVLKAYPEWCERRGFKPMTDEAFGAAFVVVCQKAGIEIVPTGKAPLSKGTPDEPGLLVCLNVRLAA